MSTFKSAKTSSMGSAKSNVSNAKTTGKSIQQSSEQSSSGQTIKTNGKSLPPKSATTSTPTTSGASRKPDGGKDGQELLKRAAAGSPVSMGSVIGPKDGGHGGGGGGGHGGTRGDGSGSTYSTTSGFSDKSSFLGKVRMPNFNVNPSDMPTTRSAGSDRSLNNITIGGRRRPSVAEVRDQTAKKVQRTVRAVCVASVVSILFMLLTIGLGCGLLFGLSNPKTTTKPSTTTPAMLVFSSTIGKKS